MIFIGRPRKENILTIFWPGNILKRKILENYKKRQDSAEI